MEEAKMNSPTATTDPQTLAADLVAGRSAAVILPRLERSPIRITGTDRAAFLHNMTTADIKRLGPGEGRSAAIVNQRGCILDWVDIYTSAEAHWLITGDGRAEADLAWLERYLITEDVQIEDRSQTLGVLYMTGPSAQAELEKFVPGVANMLAHGALDASIADIRLHIFGTHGLYGNGYYLMAAKADLGVLEQAIGVRAIGETAYEILRVEAGLPALGHELIETRNPWEARLDESVSLDKGCYLGQEIVARLNAYNKVQRYLVGLQWELGAFPVLGTPLFEGDREVGQLTSMATPPGAEHAIGLGFVKAAQAQAGRHLVFKTGEREIAVEVVERPFWHGKTRPVTFSS
jgi:folate-binding protein YgfZ